MPNLRRHVNPPTVLAALALFVALGGSSFAAPAREAASNLISGKQIKNGSIASTDIKNNSVKSTDVRNGSLLKKDFKAGQLPKGATGPRGATGLTGPAGLGKLKYVIESRTFTPGQGQQIRATCPTGYYPTGGGGVRYEENTDPGTYAAIDTFLDTNLSGVANGWTGFGFNPGASVSDPNVVVEVEAVCAPGTAPDPIPSRTP